MMEVMLPPAPPRPSPGGPPVPVVIGACSTSIGAHACLPRICMHLGGSPPVTPPYSCISSIPWRFAYKRKSQDGPSHAELVVGCMRHVPQLRMHYVIDRRQG